MNGQCQHPGCTRMAKAGATGRCNTHAKYDQQRLIGEHGNGPNLPHSITPEVLAEYRRRLARFEKPAIIARELGFSLQGLRYASKREAQG